MNGLRAAGYFDGDAENHAGCILSEELKERSLETGFLNSPDYVKDLEIHFNDFEKTRGPSAQYSGLIPGRRNYEI